VEFFSKIKRKKLFIAIFASTIIILMAISYPIIFDVKTISLPPIDRGQYIEGRTAVWGAQDLIQTIRSQSKKEKRKAIVLAEGNFGLIADVLEAMKKPDDDIEIHGFWPLNEEDIYNKLPDTEENIVYVVFSHREEFPVHWREVMEEIAVYQKPGLDPSAVYLFKLEDKHQTKEYSSL
jgi:hypothetical protein